MDVGLSLCAYRGGSRGVVGKVSDHRDMLAVVGDWAYLRTAQGRPGNLIEERPELFKVSIEIARHNDRMKVFWILTLVQMCGSGGVMIESRR